MSAYFCPPILPLLSGQLRAEAPGPSPEAPGPSPHRAVTLSPDSGRRRCVLALLSESVSTPDLQRRLTIPLAGS